MTLLEKYLKVEFSRDSASLHKLETVSERCSVDYKGNLTLFHVTILRMLGDSLDKSGSELLRMEGDRGVESKQPYIKCMEDEGSGEFLFNIIVEKEPLLKDIDNLPPALASYIHVVFILDMNFPAGAETLADVIQRKFARFGSYEGTRTTKNAKKAFKKMEEFMKRLGCVV